MTLSIWALRASASLLPPPSSRPRRSPPPSPLTTADEVQTPPISVSEITIFRSETGSAFVPAPLFGEIEGPLRGAAVVRLPHDFPQLSCPAMFSRAVEEHLLRCRRD